MVKEIQTETRRVDFTLKVDEPLKVRVRRVRGRIRRRMNELRASVRNTIPRIPRIGGNSLIVFVSSATHILLFFWIGWTYISLTPPSFWPRLSTLLAGIMCFWVSSHIILKAFEGADRRRDNQ